ncbi:MAG: hypothetical protein AAGD38_22065 [Acidobacteriota bacterium]
MTKVRSLFFMHSLTVVLAFSLFIGSGVLFATTIDETIVMAPGNSKTNITVPGGATLVSWEGSLYGDFDSASFSYEPYLAFWEVGSDVILLHYVESSVDVIKRVRVVAGETGWDGDLLTMDDLTGAPADWANWQLSTSPAPVIVPGLLGDAYLLELPSSGAAPSISGVIDPDDGHGQGSTNSTTAMDVTVRDIPTFNRSNQGGTKFFEIREDQTTIASLSALWNPTTSLWEIELSSGSSSSTVTHALDSDEVFVTVTRSTPTFGAPSTTLTVDEQAIGVVPTSAHSSLFETHELLMEELPGPLAAGSDLVFEKPTARTSRVAHDPTQRIAYDSFDGGVGLGWTVGNPGPQSTSTQDLPGPGSRFDIDLALMSALQSSFLERLTTVSTSSSATRPTSFFDPGYGIRFWVDLSDITIAADEPITLATACPPVGLPCNALRVWVEYDGTHYTIGANAGLSTGNSPTIAQVIREDLDAGVYWVEARMRNAYSASIQNGSVDLWIDGKLAERAVGLDNHQHVPERVRFGVIGDTTNSTGILGLDDFEIWQVE